MPIIYSTYRPSPVLMIELGRLKTIAALSHLVGLYELKEQAITAHDKLVVAYNSQLPVERPKGFWGQLKDNLLFRDLDQTFIDRLTLLRDSQELTDHINIFTHMSQADLMKMLEKSLKSEY